MAHRGLGSIIANDATSRVADIAINQQCATTVNDYPDPSDAWDPRNWSYYDQWMDQREWRIYGDDDAQTWCVVDREDYEWACQQNWHANKPHPKRNGKKRYFRSRAGWREGGGVYLHVAIMLRTGIRQQSAKHTLVDHIDGNEFNCQRSNLEWVTTLQNYRRTARKRKGVWSYV